MVDFRRNMKGFQEYNASFLIIICTCKIARDVFGLECHFSIFLLWIL